MDKQNGRRMVIRLHRPDIIDLVDDVPRGFKSAVIELAMGEFLSSEICQKMRDQFKRRTTTST